MCRNAADKEALEGSVKYFPTSRALSFSYFPYMGQKNDNGKIKNVSKDTNCLYTTVGQILDLSHLKHFPSKLVATAIFPHAIEEGPTHG